MAIARSVSDPACGSRHLRPEDLWERTAREAAREGSADGLAMTFAPMLDVSRDPRWGRTAEGPGEDPWLNAHASRRPRCAASRAPTCRRPIRWRPARSISSHTAPVTAGREYAAVDISERTLREVHLPGFAAAVRAGVVDADARLHRSQRRADDCAQPPAARLAARRDGLGRRHRQRLQRDRGIDQARRRGRSRRCRGTGAEGRRRHRHDGRRVSQGSADRARRRAG